MSWEEYSICNKYIYTAVIFFGVSRLSRLCMKTKKMKKMMYECEYEKTKISWNHYCTKGILFIFINLSLNIQKNKNTGWKKNLFAEQDFASSTHVLSSLGSTLVLASLKTNDGLASSQLFIGEITGVLVSWFGTQVWTGPCSILPCLLSNIKKYPMWKIAHIIYFVCGNKRPEQQ